MKVKFLQVISLVVFSITVNADNDLSSKEIYYKNLSFIHILLENVEFFKQACKAEHPEYKVNNQAAYERWAKKNRDFVNEIDGYMNEFISQSPDSVGFSQEEVKEKFAQEMFQGQQLILKSLKRYLNEETSQDFKTWCENYPNYTQSEKTDIINTYHDRVSAMREARLEVFSDNIKKNNIHDREVKSLEHDLPSVVIHRDQLGDLGKMKMGDILMLANARIPFPKENDSVSSLIKQIQSTDNQIIEQTEILLMVQGIKDSGIKDKPQQAFIVSYELKDGTYIKGPNLIKIFKIETNNLDSIEID